MITYYNILIYFVKFSAYFKICSKYFLRTHVIPKLSNIETLIYFATIIMKLDFILANTFVMLSISSKKSTKLLSWLKQDFYIIYIYIWQHKQVDLQDNRWFSCIFYLIKKSIVYTRRYTNFCLDSVIYILVTSQTMSRYITNFPQRLVIACAVRRYLKLKLVKDMFFRVSKWNVLVNACPSRQFRTM